ncbi:MAG: type II toxin-antitoxin system VapC family toxin [Acidobacteriota bacterium]|nr:type II toxin-antitoxin system VapC family toxin [Acidobacteriota bacterium]
MDCVTDTHALIWYLFAMPELSSDAKNFMDNVAASGGNIFIPTISFVEIIYLAEKGKLGANVLPRINAAIQTANSVLKSIELTHQITTSLAWIPRSIVPDMPDRIIAATALHLNIPLVTKDHKIQALQNLITIW